MPETLIVGGGLVGLLTALHLADAGQRCAVVDRCSGEDSASLASAGGIYQQLQPLFDPPETVRRHGNRIGPLIQASLPAWFRLSDRLPGLPLRITGGIIVAFDEAGMAALRRKHDIESALGLRSTMLSGAEVRSISPGLSGAILGGCFAPDEGQCEPRGLMALVRSELVRRRVPLLAGHSVDRIEPGGSTIRLHPTHGSHMDCNRVVLATGGFTGPLLDHLGIPHGIQAFPIQMCATGRTDIEIPLLTRAIGRKLSLKNMAGRVWIGGGWEATAFDHVAGVVSISQENLRKNIANAAAVVPALRSVPIERHWGGWVAWTSDGLPVVGAVPHLPNLLLACGGNGFSLAPLYAELLAAMALGESPALSLDDFSVERFCPTRASAWTMTEIPPD
jgi:glycine/D-amino acid oxidase-like deaminating enzyme